MRMHRHHLLEILLWPNGDGTFRKILSSKKRLRELGIYDDWKLTITIPADEHSRMHCNNRPDGYWDKVSQSMSAALTGKKHSEEAKAKISATMKGITPWNKGKKLSEETKEKMSKAQIGRFVSAEHRAKISAAKKGKKLTAEHRAKISTAQKGNTKAKGKRSEEAKAKMSAAKKGRSWYNNGIRSVLTNECPPGFTSGRIIKKKSSYV